MSEPMILYPNLTSIYSITTAYGMDIAALFDRRIDLQTTTTSGNSDSLAVAFWNYPSSGAFSFDRIILTKHNLKFGLGYGLKIYPYLSAVLQSMTNETRVELTDVQGYRQTVVKFDALTVDSVVIGFMDTATANQQKSASEIIITKPIVSINQDFSSYEQKWREKMKEISLGDGGLHKVVTLAGNGRNLRYEANCQFRFLSESIVESLRSLKESGQTFLFQPESESRPQDVFLCHWTGPWDAKYSSSYKGAGYTVTMQVKEI